MILGALAEVLSLGMVVPFLSAVTAPERLMQNRWTQALCEHLNLDSGTDLVLFITCVFIAAAIFSGVTRLGLLWWQTRLGNLIGADLGVEAFRRTLYQSYTVHINRNSSVVLSVLMNKISTVVYYIIIPTLSLVTGTVVALALVALLLWMDPILTAVAFTSLGILYGAIVLPAKKQISKDSKVLAANQTRTTTVIQEALGGIKEVIIGNLQEPYARLYADADAKLRRAHGNVTIMSGAPRPVIESAGVALIGIFALYLSAQHGGLASSIPILGALALAAQRLLPFVQQCYAGWSSILGARDALADVLELVEQPMPTKETTATQINFNDEIKLCDVSFSHHPLSSFVLRGINLRIPKGSTVGLIGATGCGKSTLLDIIMGLLVPSTGILMVDGLRIDGNSRQRWQKLIAHVPQVIFLADTTVRENIALGISPADIDEERIQWAAKMAQIADDIKALDEGFDTIVGERGVRLSGGQRQRLGIARALYKRSEVIIWDEATSALDSETEEAVMKALDSLRGHITVLLVAHRVTTLRNCDFIVKLDDGRISLKQTYKEMFTT